MAQPTQLGKSQDSTPGWWDSGPTDHFAQFSHRITPRPTWPAEPCSFSRDLPALSL